MDILKKIKKKIRGIGKRAGLMDDFNWSVYYEDEYSKQIYDLEKKYTFVLPENGYRLVDGKIILNSDLLPLNENHRVLYETIYDLKPASILEIGCGCGDHLVNIKKILPGAELNGSDLSPKQLDFLFLRHPELKNKANIFVQDITSSSLKNVRADMVFTQAVLMHIKRREFYLNALKNIFFLAKKYIVLMENWTRHNFVEDIREVSRMPDFPWPKIYFYANDDGAAQSLVISPNPLANFKELKDNKELLKYL